MKKDHVVFEWSKLNETWIQLFTPCGFYSDYEMTQHEAYDLVRNNLKFNPARAYMIRKISRSGLVFKWRFAI